MSPGVTKSGILEVTDEGGGSATDVNVINIPHVIVDSAPASTVTNDGTFATPARQDTGNASLASILAQLDVALSTRASQVTIASILSQLDVALSTRASQVTVASILSQLDVALSTRASQTTLASVLAQLDVALSTRASQTTVASILAQLDVALSTRLAEATFTGRINTLGQKTMANSTPVVLPSDQTSIPVAATVTAPDTTSSGTISTNGATVVISTAGLGTVGIFLSITSGTAIYSITIEYSLDGISYLSAKYSTLDVSTFLVGATLPVFATTTQVLAIVPCVGYTNIRLRCTGKAAGSGSVSYNTDTRALVMTLLNPIEVSPGLDSLGYGVQAAGILGQLDDTSTATVTENNFAPVRISTRRALITERLKTPLTASAPTVASVGVASAQAVASNANRKGLSLINTSSNNISFGIGATAVLNSGITLVPNGVWEMDIDTFSTAAINAIAAGAASNLAIQEFT